MVILPAIQTTAEQRAMIVRCLAVLGHATTRELAAILHCRVRRINSLMRGRPEFVRASPGGASNGPEARGAVWALSEGPE